MDSETLLKICSRGDLQLLKAYISESTSDQIESIRDQNQASCLHYASRNGCINILQYLICEKKISPFLVSEVGATCLHDAAVKGRINAIEWLLKNTKLTSSHKDSNGATIWHLSSKFDQIDLIDWLIGFEGTKGAKAVTFNGATCHHFAASANAIRCLKRLVQILPSYVNNQMVNGITPIYLVIQENNLPVTKFLLKSGASLNLRAEEGMSIMHVACQNGNLTMVQMLSEEFSASLNESDQNGATPLHYACVNGNPKLVAYLLSNGVEIKADKFGNSPLHDAALNGHLECARLLIASKCDVSLKDGEGMSASDVASVNGFKNLAEEIKKFEQQKSTSHQTETVLQKSLTNRSLRKSPTSLLNSVHSPLFTDLTGVPSSTPSSDLDKLDELSKINSRTYTKNQAFLQLTHRSQLSMSSSQCDVTQVSAIDELDRCIAEFENSSKQSTKVYIDCSSIYSESDKTMNKLSPDQNNNVVSSKMPPPAPPLPSWNQRKESGIDEKSPFGFLKQVDRSRKTFNFMDELNNQLKRKNESCSKFEQTLEDIQKVTEYRVLRKTDQQSNMPEWKRKLIERKKLRQSQDI
ncbi:espin isoform X1 [Brachionus plicatilis]|uniref:Espin isoform X1 n=1 Tax=Brachionus plicatilis TaxID=10195 RepID=A0A3M7T7E9_BRAPC|nr:espin isoform X1 [Brachionus plicatilis]